MADKQREHQQSKQQQRFLAAQPTLVLQDVRTDALAARGFANFLFHWHAGFKAAWEAGIPYALNPLRVGYINDRNGFCVQKNCTDYVDIFRFGLLDRSRDVIGDDADDSGRVLLPARLPHGKNNWSGVVRDAIAASPRATSIGFTCDLCADGDFANTAGELRRRIIGTASRPRHGHVRIAVHARRGDMIGFPIKYVRDRLLPDRWYLQILNSILDVCTALSLACSIDLYSQGGLYDGSGRGGEQNRSLLTVKSLSLRYKHTAGGQVDEFGRAADWRPLLHCKDCLRTFLNGEIEHDLKQLATSDVLVGSCSAFSHFAAMLGEGIAVLPSNVFTSKGFAGVLSAHGFEHRALVVHNTNGSTFDVPRFARLMAVRHGSEHGGHEREHFGRGHLGRDHGGREHAGREHGHERRAADAPGAPLPSTPCVIASLTRRNVTDVPASRTFPVLRQFAQHNGCTLRYQSFPRAGYEAKIGLLRSALEEAPTSTWVMVVDDDVCLRTKLSPAVFTGFADAMQASVIAQSMGPRVNNGIFFVKNDARGRSFAQRWMELMPRTPYAFDNGAFNVALLGKALCLSPARSRSAMASSDACMNECMSGTKDMCMLSDKKRAYLVNDSGALVLCPRNGLLPMLQSEDHALATVRGHPQDAVFRTGDFSIHTKIQDSCQWE